VSGLTYLRDVRRSTIEMRINAADAAEGTFLPNASLDLVDSIQR